MNTESQNIEWKESWRDEYLKWICGFANAQGGRLIIGKSDTGTIVGVDNVQRLLVDIPNKVRDTMGIVVEVNRLEAEHKELLEIVVEAYPYPVSYKGEYHLRSGATKQELRGAALDQFILRKQGRTWDDVPIPGLTAGNLSSQAIRSFQQLAATGTAQ
jgi:ATP-dependent DNA helicase RecG